MENYNKCINKFLLILIAIYGIFSIFGSCTQTKYKWQAPPITKSNIFFNATITPQCSPHCCDGFRLDILNLTNYELDIIWAKTIFISEETPNGLFFWDGIAFKDRNSHNSSELIVPKGRFSRVIYPSNYVSLPDDFILRGQGIMKRNCLADGENGVYLVIRADGKEISEKIITNIKGEKIK